jgi:cytoskeletal protein CcmA (bactofilin family)
VSNKGASSAAPFASGDSLLVDIMLSGDKGDVGSLPSGAGTGNVFSSLTSTTVTAGTVMKTVSTTSSTLFLEPTTITVDSSNNMTGIGTLSLSGGSITIRSDSGSPGYIDMYCEVNNLHYSRLQAQPHANYSGNITITLPATSGTLALLAQKANFTDVTASTLTVSGNISADTITVTDITATGSASTIGAVAFTSTAATVTGNLTVTGSVTASSLTVNGDISASTITVADITATGSASTIGALAITTTSATLTGDLSISGSVGIGTSSATGKFEVLGSLGSVRISNGGDQISFTNDGVNYISAAGSSAHLRLNAGVTTRFATAGVEHVRITGAGRVGIGTDNPGAKFQVQTSSNANIAIVSSTAGTSSIEFGDSDDRNAGLIQYLNTDNAMTFRTGGSGEDVRIDSDGNVLIGTSSSTTDLGYQRKLKISGNGPALILEETDESQSYSIGALGSALVVRDATNTAERMRIDSAGGVGINTTSITSGTSLEVAGNMRITTTGNGLIFPDGSKQTAAATAGIGIGKAIAMTLVFG